MQTEETKTANQRDGNAALCGQCEASTVNGVLCHEHGCPDAWRDEERECLWCGAMFTPDDRMDKFCDDSCMESFDAGRVY